MVIDPSPPLSFPLPTPLCPISLCILVPPLYAYILHTLCYHRPVICYTTALFTSSCSPDLLAASTYLVYIFLISLTHLEAGALAATVWLLASSRRWAGCAVYNTFLRVYAPISCVRG